MRALLLVVFTSVLLTLAACETNSEETLVVGLECDYAPFNWTSQEGGEPIDGQPFYCDGYDVEIARLIAAELDRELVIRQVSWEGLIPALQSGSIDAIIAGMSPTAERAESVRFTDPYFVSEQVLVMRESSDFVGATSLNDLAGARVVAQLGTLQDRLIEQIPNVDHQTPLETYASLVTAVSSGASDMLIAELPVALSITANNPQLITVTLEEGFVVEASDVSVSVAVHLDQAALQEAINAALALISVETREALMTDALSRADAE